MTEFETVVGLEIHAELATNSKAFCGCEAVFGKEPNCVVCPECMGLPGALPVINRKIVELAVKAGISFNCHINKFSSFDRKNYCYPDLPKAYQITQYFHPICVGGYVPVGEKKYPLERIHIEEDAGKLTHLEKENVSLADYNRCGLPLIEIVSAPVLKSGKEAADFARQVALTLKYTGVCNCRMEKGNLRCDVNISVKKKGETALGTRTEIKNLNSFRAVEHAVELESKRQIDLILKGESVKRQTLNFNDLKGTLTPMRQKEELADYRYFPEPDLPPVCLSDYFINCIKASMPELPRQKEKRYTEVYNLSLEDARQIINNPFTATLFEAAACNTDNISALVGMINTELPRIFKNLKNKPFLLTAEMLADICNMLDCGEINMLSAKELIKLTCETGQNPKEVAEKRGMLQETDEEKIITAVKTVINANPKAVNDYLSGGTKVFGFLMGQTAKLMGPSANPKIIKRMLEEALKNAHKN